ncbi:MAG: helix-turn-helix transcriptional regulator [Acidimicrobiales bacterium]
MVRDRGPRSTTGGHGAPLFVPSSRCVVIETSLSGPDMARELIVSLNTMRTHPKNIYMKLGANNRRAAVRRGQELSLLSGPR